MGFLKFLVHLLGWITNNIRPICRLQLCTKCPLRRCTHFSSDITSPWITQQSSAGKCAHRHASARRERHEKEVDIANVDYTIYVITHGHYSVIHLGTLLLLVRRSLYPIHSLKKQEYLLYPFTSIPFIIIVTN